MTQPTLHYLDMPGPRARHSQERRLAWWEWSPSGADPTNHVVVCVHGLTRQARDFDVLSAALASRARVVCVDVAGRGHSDWLEDPMAYQIPTYVTDLAVLLGHLRQAHAQAHPDDERGLRIDWIGTSMGGLIGMALAAQPALGIRRLVLNDVGPTLEWSALERIGSYLGQAPEFPSEQAAADYLAALSTGFGPHSSAQWLALSRPMLRPSKGGWTLHYDPAIAAPYRAMLQATDQAAAREALHVGAQRLWQLYDAITAPTLLLRGAQSDLLTQETAQTMTQRGPRARCVEFAGIGHAPTLVAADQVAVVKDFLLAP
jgi:pimeloyl-ACP methyl ester carboxylesterase